MASTDSNNSTPMVIVDKTGMAECVWLHVNTTIYTIYVFECTYI